MLVRGESGGSEQHPPEGLPSEGGVPERPVAPRRSPGPPFADHFARPAHDVGPGYPAVLDTGR